MSENIANLSEKGISLYADKMDDLITSHANDGEKERCVSNRANSYTSEDSGDQIEYANKLYKAAGEIILDSKPGDVHHLWNLNYNAIEWRKDEA
jgi:hypothetical protein